MLAAKATVKKDGETQPLGERAGIQPDTVAASEITAVASAKWDAE